MADVYGVNRTKIEAMTPANLLATEESGGKVCWVYDSYTAAALAEGAVLYVCRNLPPDARIVDWVIDHSLNTGVSLKFGTKDDDDEFMVNTSCAGADKKNMTDDGVSLALGFQITAGDGEKLIITTSGPSAATGTIKVAVAYTCKG